MPFDYANTGVTRRHSRTTPLRLGHHPDDHPLPSLLLLSFASNRNYPFTTQFPQLNERLDNRSDNWGTIRLHLGLRERDGASPRAVPGAPSRLRRSFRSSPAQVGTMSPARGGRVGAPVLEGMMRTSAGTQRPRQSRHRGSSGSPAAVIPTRPPSGVPSPEARTPRWPWRQPGSTGSARCSGVPSAPPTRATYWAPTLPRSARWPTRSGWRRCCSFRVPSPSPFDP